MSEKSSNMVEMFLEGLASKQGKASLELDGLTLKVGNFNIKLEGEVKLNFTRRKA